MFSFFPGCHDDSPIFSKESLFYFFPVFFLFFLIIFIFYFLFTSSGRYGSHDDSPIFSKVTSILVIVYVFFFFFLCFFFSVFFFSFFLYLFSLFFYVIFIFLRQVGDTAPTTIPSIFKRNLNYVYCFFFFFFPLFFRLNFYNFFIFSFFVSVCIFKTNIVLFCSSIVTKKILFNFTKKSSVLILCSISI